MKKDNIPESGTGYYKAIQERRPHAAMELIAKASVFQVHTCKGA